MRRLLLICLVMTLAGCGFHLAGSTPLPAAWTPLQLDGDNRYDDLMRAVRNELSFAGITLGSGGARLVVSELDRDERDAALDNSARVSQVMVLREVQVSLFDRDGAQLRAPVTLMHRRVFDNDPDDPVAESSERSEAQLEDSRELATRIRRQLQRWARQPQG